MTKVRAQWSKVVDTQTDKWGSHNLWVLMGLSNKLLQDTK